MGSVFLGHSKDEKTWNILPIEDTTIPKAWLCWHLFDLVRVGWSQATKRLDTILLQTPWRVLFADQNQWLLDPRGRCSLQKLRLRGVELRLRRMQARVPCRVLRSLFWSPWALSENEFGLISIVLIHLVALRCIWGRNLWTWTKISRQLPSITTSGLKLLAAPLVPLALDLVIHKSLLMRSANRIKLNTPGQNHLGTCVSNGISEKAKTYRIFEIINGSWGIGWIAQWTVYWGIYTGSSVERETSVDPKPMQAARMTIPGAWTNARLIPEAQVTWPDVWQL